MSNHESISFHLGAPDLSSRRERIRELVGRRGPGVHAEYETALREMSDDELALELERTKDTARWVGERTAGDSTQVRILPPMSSADGTS